MTTSLRHKLVLGIAGAGLIAAAFTGVASADYVINDIENDLDATREEKAVAVGGTSSVKIWVKNQNNNAGDSINRCNLAESGTAITMSISSVDEDVATVSPSEITIEDCDEDANGPNGKTITLTGVANGTTNIDVALVSTTPAALQGNFDFSPAQFIAKVGTGVKGASDPCASVGSPAAPVIESTPTTPNGDNGWFKTAVPTVSATSSTSGATISYATDGETFSSTAPTLGQGTTTVTAKATSATCNKSSTSTREFKVDSVKPAVTITSPLDEATTTASSVTVEGTFSDATSGVAMVRVNGTNATLNTIAGTFSRSAVALTCGDNTITATATDYAGNSDSDSVDVYRRCFTGAFQQPLDPNGVLNKAKLGRVVPVKITLTANDGGAVPTPVYFGHRKISCDSATGSDLVEEYAAGSSNVGNTFRLSDGVWMYNLDTSKLPNAAVNSCYQLDVYVGGTVNPDTGIASGGVPVSNGSVKIQLTK